MRYSTRRAAVFGWGFLLAGLAAVLMPGLNLEAEEVAMAPSGNDVLIPNPSFEETDGGKIIGWKAQSAGKPQVKFDHARIGHTGERSVMVSSERGADAWWNTSFEVKA